MARGTLVLLDGGHQTFVHQRKPHEVEPIITKAIEDGIPLIFLDESPNNPPPSNGDAWNTLCVNPEKVVGLIWKPGRD